MPAVNPDLQTTILDIIAIFKPVFDESNTPARASFSSAEAMLHADILALGFYVASMDNIAQRFERNLLAEMLSFLQPTTNQMPYGYVLETIDRQLAQTKQQPYREGHWPELSTFMLARNWATGLPEREKTYKKLAIAFSTLLNRFIIRDGQVTNAEINLLNAFDAHLAL